MSISGLNRNKKQNLGEGPEDHPGHKSSIRYAKRKKSRSVSKRSAIRKKLS
jgi:hypothetical protein